MSKLKELIDRLCPDGVPYIEIGELGTFFGGLSGKSKDDFKDGNAKYITYLNIYSNPALNLDIHDFVKVNVNEKQNSIQKGDILFTGSSETPNECGYTSVVTTDVNEPIFLNSFCFGLRLNNPNLFNHDFLKHILRSYDLRKQISKTASGVTRFNVSKARLSKVLLPVPPIEVQDEIATILDKFDSYAAELQARKEQYEYYRNLLLTFNPSAYGSGTDGEQEIKNVTAWREVSYKIMWKSIGEICSVITAPKKLNRKDYSTEGEYPIIDQGQDLICGYSDINDANLPDDEYVLFGDHTKTIKYFNGAFIQGADGLKILKAKNGILPKYLYHSLNVLKIEDRGYNRHWTVVSPLIIPIPPLDLQEKIVSILDRFETLVNDLTQGLPAEIAAVKEQYEYYRNKLLTFKQLA